MKISICSSMFYDRKLDEVLKLAKELGYNGVEIWGSEPHISPDTTSKRAKEICYMSDYYGLEIPVIGSHIGSFSTNSDSECSILLENLEKYFNLMSILKCDLIRVGCGGPSVFLAQKYHFEKALHWINQCADLGKLYNKRIAIEIHNGSLIETVESADNFMKELNRDNVGLIHDAGNMYITDTDYGLMSVEILGKNIFHVHVKDEKRVEDDTLSGTFHSRTIYGDEIFQHKLLDEGAVDHVQLFKGLLKIGYEGFLSSECHAPLPAEDRAKLEIDEIKRQLIIAKESI